MKPALKSADLRESADEAGKPKNFNYGKTTQRTSNENSKRKIHAKQERST
jgi:hypothetical protein